MAWNPASSASLHALFSTSKLETLVSATKSLTQQQTAFNSSPETGQMSEVEQEDFKFVEPLPVPTLQLHGQALEESLLSIPTFQVSDLEAALSSTPSQPLGTAFDNFDYGFVMPTIHSTVVQVPSPWIRAIESPMETPLSTFGTPMGTPMLSTPMQQAPLLTPWASPFMGSPYLSPFEDPMSQAAKTVQPAMDISNWWAENSSFVDQKTFGDLLADSGILWLI
ncbi:hypothetical protein HDU91_002069 [Kappamyces sp. JEL0680]|nr:hypothetical protein HDU91_002069 [Kappamyces sp. JEL0680]